MKKFVYRLAALLWLINNPNEELYFDNDSDDIFCCENDITPVTFIQVLDEVVDRFFTTWWRVISQPYNPMATPWYFNLANSSKRSTMSPHHEEWMLTKLLTPGKVHFYTYEGTRYPFAVKEYGYWSDGSGYPSVEISIVIDDTIHSMYNTLPNVYRELKRFLIRTYPVQTD